MTDSVGEIQPAFTGLEWEFVATMDLTQHWHRKSNKMESLWVFESPGSGELSSLTLDEVHSPKQN